MSSTSSWREEQLSGQYWSSFRLYGVSPSSKKLSTIASREIQYSGISKDETHRRDCWVFSHQLNTFSSKILVAWLPVPSWQDGSPFQITSSTAFVHRPLKLRKIHPHARDVLPILTISSTWCGQIAWVIYIWLEILTAMLLGIASTCANNQSSREIRSLLVDFTEFVRISCWRAWLRLSTCWFRAALNRYLLCWLSSFWRFSCQLFSSVFTLTHAKLCR